MNSYLLAISYSPTAQKPSYFLCLSFGLSQPAAVFGAVTLPLLFPYCQSIGGYFYDFPELAFFALSVLLAMKADWWWLIPCVALGEWNKESFLLLVLTLYPILRLRYSKRRAAIAVGMLSAICLAVYMGLRSKFGYNPGGTVEMRWLEQLQWFTHPKYFLFETEETYGMRVLRPMTGLPMGLLLWTIARTWKHLPKVVRQHGLIAAAINVPLYFLFCAPGELRDLSMLSILVLLCIAGNLNSWFTSCHRIERS